MTAWLFDPLEKHSLLLLDSLQFRLEAQAIPERFGNDNPPDLINPQLHTINPIPLTMPYTFKDGEKPPNSFLLCYLVGAFL